MDLEISRGRPQALAVYFFDRVPGFDTGCYRDGPDLILCLFCHRCVEGMNGLGYHLAEQWKPLCSRLRLAECQILFDFAENIFLPLRIKSEQNSAGPMINGHVDVTLFNCKHGPYYKPESSIDDSSGVGNVHKYCFQLLSVKTALT